MPAKPTGLESYFLQLVNGTRASAGVSPLSFDDQLMIAADNYSAWMDANDNVSHAGPNGSSVESIWYFYGTDETGELSSGDQALRGGCAPVTRKHRLPGYGQPELPSCRHQRDRR